MTTNQRTYQSYYYPLLMALFCLITRVFTHIDYIEDVDSLRFALGVQNYDVASFQPHFPAYPVFCFLVKCIYSVSGNLGFSFAVLGGVAIFLIAYYLPKLILGRDNIFLSTLVIVNPLFWIMSNRFMPDLLGLGIAIASLCYFRKWYFERDQYAGVYSIALFALLAGVRLSYFPLLLVPTIFILSTAQKHIWSFLGTGIVFVLIWLIPLIVDTGWDELIFAAQKQTQGHFQDFGGTVYNEPDILLRAKAIVIYTWADGLGGWLPGRHWLTMINSLMILSGLVGFVFNYQGRKFTRFEWLLIGCFLLYFIWVLLFQNVLYKSRHIMPLLIPFLILAYQGYSVVKLKAPRYTLLSLLVLANLTITVPLVLQHRQPTAIEQVIRYLKPYNNFRIAGPELLKKRVLLASFNGVHYDIDIAKPAGEEVLFTFTSQEIDGYTYVGDTTFYHNPFVNRMWPEVSLYRYEKK